MPVVEPRHVAMWSKAHELTRPGPDEQPPTYGAHHRKRAERVLEHESDETPEALDGAVSDGE